MVQQKIESDLDILCEEAKKLGAVGAVASKASDIIVDLRANLKCRVPICPYYGKNLMCPPHIMSASEFQEVLSKYTYGVLIQVEIPIPDEVIQAAYQSDDIGDFFKNRLSSFSSVWSKLNEVDALIGKVEAAAFGMGYRFAAGFSGGHCKLCDECVAGQPGATCRHPFKARPAMEAVGIDVIGTAEKAGFTTANALAENKIVAYGLVLVD